MERIKAPSGSKGSIEKILDDLQLKSFLNLTKRVKSIFKSLGVKMTRVNGVNDTSLQLSIINSGTGLQVNSGRAIGLDGQHFIVSATSYSNISTIANGYYKVELKYIEVGGEPVQVSNAFVYDVTGALQSTSQNTRFADGYNLRLTLLSPTVDVTTLTTTDDSHILLGIVRVISNAFSSADWSGSYGAGTPVVNNGICDLRAMNRFVLDSAAILDDTVVLLKDRPSVGTNKFNQNIEFGQNVKLSGDVILPSSTVYTVQADGSKTEITSSTGPHLQVLQEGGHSKIYIPFLQSKTVKVNTGTDNSPIWSDIMVVGPSPSYPRNLRIYDIFPTENYYEKECYVEFRWNWSNLIITNLATSALTITKQAKADSPSNSIAENFTFSAEDISTYLPGNGTTIPAKKVYFPISQNEYEIVSVVDNGSTYTITIAGTVSGESISDRPRIIDQGLEYYRFKAVSTPAVNNSRAKSTTRVDLLYDSMYTLQYTLKLPIAPATVKTWTVSIQGVNNNSFTPIAVLGNGSYDPDHDLSGGQSPINYNADFAPLLPEITTSGNFTGSPTPNGFTINISPNWSDVLLPQETAHEYQILYSDTTEIGDSAFFDNYTSQVGVTGVITRQPQLDVITAIPATYSVGIRPLQNGWPVGAPVVKKITSGGSGTLPSDRAVYEGQIDVQTVEFNILTNKGNGQYLAVPSAGEYVNPNSIYYKQVAIPASLPNVITTISGMTNFTPGTNGAIAYVNSSAPDPKYYAFRSSVTSDHNNLATTEIGTYANDTTWSRISTPTTTVAVNEIVTLKFTAVAASVARTECRAFIVNNSTGTRLRGGTYLTKSDYYPVTNPGQYYHTKNVVVTWKNTTGSTVTVRGDILGWGAFNYNGVSTYQLYSNPVSAHKTYLAIFAGNLPGLTKDDVSISQDATVSYGTPRFNFGFSAHSPSFQVDNALTDASPHKFITSAKIETYASGYGHIYQVGLMNETGLTAGQKFVLGTTKSSRHIAKIPLKVDYKITQISFEPASVTGASVNNPGFIRVYQQDQENLAGFLAVEGNTGQIIASQVSVDISLDINNTRILVIDAYDPAEGGTNNFVELVGRLTITGEVKIKNRINTI